MSAINTDFIRQDLDRAHAECHALARQVDTISPDERAELLLAAGCISAARAAIYRLRPVDVPAEDDADTEHDEPDRAPVSVGAMIDAAHANANDLGRSDDAAVEAVIALVRHEPSPTTEPTERTAVPIEGDRRLRQLRRAVKLCGWTAPEAIRRLPADVVADSPRPGSLVDIAADARLYSRVIHWLAEEEVA